MLEWLIFLVMAMIEAWEDVFFMDTFLECKWSGSKRFLRYPVCFLAITAAALLSAILMRGLPSDILRMLLVIVSLGLCGRLSYFASWGLSFFLSFVYYMMLMMLDLAFSWIAYVGDGVYVSALGFAVRCLWLVILLLIRKSIGTLKEYFREKTSRWLRYMWFPAITSAIALYFILNMQTADEHRLFFSFLSVLLVGLNYASLLFLKYALEHDAKLENLELRLQKKQNQQQVFRDMQTLYESQGKKLHDYKKQLLTIQELLENENTETAVELARKLTNSISVEMAEINTGHAIVNAVLNQAYRMCRIAGVGMIFAVGDMRGIRVEDEDIIILFGNLLENAIHECERLVKSGISEVAMRVKLKDVGENILFTVQNPVLERVLIEEDRVLKKAEEGHGIGLLNVREVAWKYDGTLSISCDEKEFTATVMI